MSANIIKEKEKQENLVYVFVFLMIFIVLFWVFPPSFNFSFSSQGLTEKESHHDLIRILDEINMAKFSDFQTPPEFDEVSGRDNPFSSDLVRTEREEILEEEVPEEEESEEIEEEIIDED